MLMIYLLRSFIHGGAWRDRLQDSKELQPALSQLLTWTSAGATLDRIAGFASINYGLSGGNEGEKGLNTKHPGHIQDVLTAMKWLRAEYNVGALDESGKNEKGWDWVVVGHSCGATMAFQLCMSYSKPWGDSEDGSWDGKPPVAVIGLEGIYDLPLLNQTHIDQPFYAEFITSAFGSSQKTWKEVSPIGGDFSSAFQTGGMKVVVLGHSAEDELVEYEQAETMWRCLEDQGWSVPGTCDGRNGSAKDYDSGKQLTRLDLKGTHDEVWSEGTGVRTSIEVAIRSLFPTT
jgi:kynurenine formamidase